MASARESRSNDERQSARANAARPCARSLFASALIPRGPSPSVPRMIRARRRRSTSTQRQSLECRPILHIVTRRATPRRARADPTRGPARSRRGPNAPAPTTRTLSHGRSSSALTPVGSATADHAPCPATSPSTAAHRRRGSARPRRPAPDPLAARSDALAEVPPEQARCLMEPVVARVEVMGRFPTPTSCAVCSALSLVMAVIDRPVDPSRRSARDRPDSLIRNGPSSSSGTWRGRRRALSRGSSGSTDEQPRE